MKKINLSTYTIKKTDFRSAKEILKPDIVIQSGIKKLDQILGGFKTGTITYIDGDSNLISNITDQISVKTYQTFERDTIYIDAGMCADPYKIARYARKMELDQKKILKHIHISRAFTLYQLSTLIQDMLEKVIKRYKPQTLIIGNFPIFYLDSDVEEKEAKIILRSNLHKIHELTTKYNLITIFTNFNKKSNLKRNINKILCKEVDETIVLKETKLATNVRLLNKKKETMILHLKKGQLQLHEFGMVI